jgi:hypothetical protein
MAVHDPDRPLRAVGNAVSAAVAFRFVNADDLSFHRVVSSSAFPLPANQLGGDYQLLEQIARN